MKLQKGTDRQTLFTLAPNSITKLRIYIYLEGQDIDNYDLAAGGRQVKVNFGFTKARFDSEDEEYSESTGDHDGVIQETLESLRTKYPNARIDISNIWEAKGQFMQVSSGANYTLSIKGVTEDLHGEWVYDPQYFYIQDDNIIPLHAGSCRIVYKVNGIEFLDKTITVKQ